MMSSNKYSACNPCILTEATYPDHDYFEISLSYQEEGNF